MRKSLGSLSLLVALAGVASAQSTATATASTSASYNAASSVRLLELAGEGYHVYADGSEGNYSYDVGGPSTMTSSSSTTNAYTAATNSFTMSATANASFSSTDYAAINPAYPDGDYIYRVQGYRYLITLYNTTDQDQTVAFHLSLNQTYSRTATSPYGTVSYDADGTYTPGAFADASLHGGVTDRSTEDQFSNLPNVQGGYFASAYDTNPGVSTPTFGGTDAYGYDASYVLPGGAIHTYQIYAASTVSAQFVPVPEPSALAALAVGALALLRRRRK